MDLSYPWDVRRAIRSLNLTPTKIREYLKQIKENFDAKDYCEYVTDEDEFNYYIDPRIKNIHDKNDPKVLISVLVNMTMGHLLRLFNAGAWTDPELIIYLLQYLLEALNLKRAYTGRDLYDRIRANSHSDYFDKTEPDDFFDSF